MKRFLNMARRFALGHEFNPAMSSNHCALVVKASRVLGVGFNRHGWSSKQEGLYPVKQIQDNCCTVHAEVDALLKVSNREEIQGATVYVIRVTKNNKLAMSKPCPMCEEILREHGVRRVFFSITEDENAHGVVDFR